MTHTSTEQPEALKLAHEIGANRIKVMPTEQERQRFEQWMAGHCWKVGGTWDGTTYRGAAEHGDYLDPQAMHTRQLFAAWRDCAALRDRIAPAPALEVERLREAAQRAHDWMDSQADSQSKGNYHSFDLFCLRQERDALAEALAAAPQPPEADMGIPISQTNQQVEAPVQLPEPPFWYCESKTPDAIWPIGRTTKKRESAFKDGYFNQQALYTEQQVRQLLAAHGIKEQST